MDNPLITLRDLFQALTQEVRDAVAAEPAATDWSEIHLDVRYSKNGSPISGKIRSTVDGQPVSVSMLYGSVTGLVKEIWDVWKGERFYGFVMSITAEGEVDIRLNYDRNSFADPGFWAS